MSILLGFLPFLVFVILSASAGPLVALIASAAASAGLILRNRARGGSLKILEAGTFVLFAALAVWSAISGQGLSIIAARLCVDIGLLAIVLVSMIVRRPFTLEYAKEQVAKDHWTNPLFIRANYVITAAWAVAFLVMVIAEAAMIAMPDIPRSLGTIVIVAALLGGVLFTRWRAKPRTTV